MLTRFVYRQLILFGIISVVTAIALGLYYLRVPTAMGIGQYTLKADLPTSGGLYKTANVTYRGETIGKITAVEPTETGVQATMSIGNGYKIPVDASANVHSVSAVGEQYLDLVSVDNPGKYLSPGQTITKASVPAEIGPALDAANRGLAVLPKEKISQLLDETAQAVGGLGPRCSGWSTRLRRSPVTSRPTSPISTTSSRTPRRSWTARSTRAQRSNAGRTT